MPAKVVVALNQSLDGYVDHDLEGMTPDAELFEHWTECVRTATAAVYGRRMYEIMRYWDDEHPEWTPAERAFAQAWRHQPKWVASASLTSVGPNATLVGEGIASTVAHLKARLDGEIDVSGTQLAASLADEGLVDEYRLYVHPVVAGGGTPFFPRARARLRLVGSTTFGGSVIRLTYATS